MRRIFLAGIICVVLLALPSVFAYTLSVETVNNRAYEGESLNYTINITNDLNISDSVTFFDLVFVGQFVMNYIPSNRLTLTAGESRIINVSILSTDDTPLAIEIPFKIYFNSEGDANDTVILKGRFDKLPDFYLKPLIKEIIIGDVIDPRIGQSLIAVVYNPDDRTMNVVLNYSVKKGEAVVLSGGVEQSLEPYSTTNVVLPVNLNYYQEPGMYSFIVQAYNGDSALPANETVFEVGGFAEFSVSPDIEKNIFGKNLIITVENTGTAIGSTSFTLSILPIERWLRYSSNVNVTYADGELNFTVSLLPGQQRIIEYKVTYIPLYLLPLFLIVLGYAYWYFTRRLDVVRTVSDIQVGDEYFSFKIVIRIKNLSNEKLKDIRVKEKLLPFAKKVGSYGTLHPKFVSNSSEKKLLWEVGELGPKDEAVITYRINTSIGIIGRIFLPATQVKFKYKGHTNSSSSSVLIVSPDEEK